MTPTTPTALSDDEIIALMYPRFTTYFSRKCVVDSARAVIAEVTRRASIAPAADELAKKMAELADELDAEADNGANWTKAQHTCVSVGGSLRSLAKRVDDQIYQLVRALREATEAPTFDPGAVPVFPQYLIRGRFVDGCEIYLDVRGVYDLGGKLGIDVQMPEQFESPMAETIRAEVAPAAAPVAQEPSFAVSCSHQWELMSVGPTTTQHSWRCRACGAQATTWPKTPGERALIPDASTPITGYLAAPIAPTGVAGWKPIETAPRDGTKILVWWAHATKDQPGVSISYWLDNSKTATPWAGWAFPKVIVPGMYAAFWMPLPAAPTAPAAGDTSPIGHSVESSSPPAAAKRTMKPIPREWLLKQAAKFGDDENCTAGPDQRPVDGEP